ncbi:MAG: RDD family protein [Rhodocyclaceae bacterium]|nr:RDD family protein [Rhodocyclaceae bacterium]
MPSPPLPAPSIRRRLASMIYDFLLLIGVFFFVFLVPNIILGVAAETMLPRGILLVYAILVIAGYFLWFWRHNGRTLAMQTWKIRLRSANGTAASSGQLLLRFMLAWPSLFFFGAGIIWAVFDRDRQFLHDRLSGTRLEFVA